MRFATSLMLSPFHIYITLQYRCARGRDLRNRIVTVSAFDIRFPTSEHLDGSDAMNQDPDYSAAYIVIETESGKQGSGLTFTIGRGNDICCRAVEAMRHLVVGKELGGASRPTWAGFYGELAPTASPLARPGKRRDAHGGRRRRQRSLGPLAQGTRGSRLAAAFGHEPRGASSIASTCATSPTC